MWCWSIKKSKQTLVKNVSLWENLDDFPIGISPPMIGDENLKSAGQEFSDESIQKLVNSAF